jgi:hypothetical protein
MERMRSLTVKWRLTGGVAVRCPLEIELPRGMELDEDNPENLHSQLSPIALELRRQWEKAYGAEYVRVFDQDTRIPELTVKVGFVTPD